MKHAYDPDDNGETHNRKITAASFDYRRESKFKFKFQWDQQCQDKDHTWNDGHEISVCTKCGIEAKKVDGAYIFPPLKVEKPDRLILRWFTLIKYGRLTHVLVYHTAAKIWVKGCGGGGRNGKPSYPDVDLLRFNPDAACCSSCEKLASRLQKSANIIRVEKAEVEKVEQS